MNEEKNMPSENKKLLGKKKEQEKLTTEEQKLIEESDEKRIKDLENLVKRVQADFDNFRKQCEKEKQDFTKTANAELIKQLLSVLDELEIASKHVKDKGIDMVHGNLLSVLKSYGLSEMKDENFDPYKHEAVKQVKGNEDGEIMEVLKKGYTLNGIVLRHALVIVSKKDEK